MHEFSVAQSIVDTVVKVAQENGASQILKVNLLIGEVALVNVEQLGWYIEMITKDTLAEGMELSVTKAPTEIRCSECGYEGGVSYREADADWHFAIPVFECPKCNSSHTFIISGKELHIKDINVKFDEDDVVEEDEENA